MQPGNTTKPLTGLTVIDFTHVLSGPFCTMMLADHGARVIKIEPPNTGDDSRAFGPFYPEGDSVYFDFVNRGKQSIALNLKDPDDLALARRMIAGADVVVENFRPGTMAKLGLDPQELLNTHPSLIVCSISGFGQTGPMRLQPAYDTVIQALSGMMSVTGFPEGLPTRVGTSIADLSAGLFAYAAITTALTGRDRTGKGTTIDMAMLDSLFVLLEHGLMDSLAEHINPQRLGNRHPSISPFDVYQCRDRMLAICCGNDHLFQQLCQALDLGSAHSEPRFASNDLRMAHQADLKVLLEERLQRQDAAVWESQLEAAGIPVGRVQTVDEAKQMAQIQVRNMVVTLGGREVPGNPIKLGGYDSSCAVMLPPTLNADSDNLRREFKA